MKTFFISFLVILNSLLLSLMFLISPAITTPLFLKNVNIQYFELPLETIPTISSSIAKYFYGLNDELTIEYKNANYSHLLSSKEIDHMKDVKNIFKTIKVCIFISCSLLFWCLTSSFSYKKILKKILFLLFLLFTFITIACFNFNYLFILMHKLLFSNNNWMLTPGVDLIISLMPLSFFIEISIVWIFIFFFILISFILLIKLKCQLAKTKI